LEVLWRHERRLLDLVLYTYVYITSSNIRFDITVFWNAFVMNTHDYINRGYNTSKTCNIVLILRSKINLSLCLTKYHIIKLYSLLNQSPHHNMYGRSGGIAPWIPNLSTRRRRVVRVIPWPHYSQKRTPVPTGWKGRPRCWAGCSDEDKKNPFPVPTRNHTSIIQPIT